MKGSWLAAALALLAVIVAALVSLVFPLTSNPGPEAAQVLGIVGGVALCLAQAARSAKRAQEGFVQDWLKSLVIAAAMLSVFLVVTGIAGALRPSCGPNRGYLPFFFLSAPVLLMQATIGTWIGRLVGRAGRAVLAALVFQIVAVVIIFASWYREPTFVVASHLYIVVAGDLLRGAAMPPAVVGFRFATLAFGGALMMLGALRYPRIRRAGLATQPVGNFTLGLIGAAFLGMGVMAHISASEELVPDRSAMEQELSFTKKRGPLVVHANPLHVRPKDVDAILAEGMLWLDRLEVRLGAKPQGDIHIWLHMSRDQQAKWTGARHVDFTLPWRREIHIVGARVPHGTLGHELAHAVAGELTDTMLRIPGDFVVVQKAAITEGVAVAVTPELATESGLTIKEQAAAMKRLGFAPSMQGLFAGLSFFTESPARAYIAAGAFIESLVARSLPEPTKAIATLYSTASLEDTLGSNDAVDELIRAHDAALDSLPLPADALSVAMARFRRPSILRDICEPEKADDARALREMVRTGRATEALMAIGPDPSRATLEDMLGDAAYVGDHAGAVLLAERLSQLDGPHDVAERDDIRGDALWRAGRLRDAVTVWDRARVETLPIDRGRTLLAKRILGEHIIAAAGDAPVSRAAIDVLLGLDTPHRAAAFERLHWWLGVDDGSPAELRREPREAVALARYIHARRLVAIGALEEGSKQFQRILEEKLVEPVYLEQSRLGLATAWMKLGRLEAARDLLIEAADAADRPAMRLLFRDRADRAQRAIAAPQQPEPITATSDPAWADRLLFGVDRDGDLG